MPSSTRIRLLGASAILACSIAAMPAYAQARKANAAQPAAETTDDDMALITVTARSRDESIVDVPMAITVVTSARLEQLAIKDTSELAKCVPGLEFNNYSTGYARNDLRA